MNTVRFSLLCTLWLCLLRTDSQVRLRLDDVYTVRAA